MSLIKDKNHVDGFCQQLFFNQGLHERQGKRANYCVFIAS
ncbi:hypothetical protein yaldo0001_2470 [Yersinia aldovae ATCC 35236]|nr:hypothetical protein yaldo0001_2470 [Yersinia aldovae ATCC 35236]